MQDDNNTFLPENKPGDPEKEDKVYKLKRPFQFEGDTISEVKLLDMTAGDLMAVDRESAIFRKARGYTEPAGDIERSGYVIARYTGLTIEAVEMMHPADFVTLSQKAGDFLG